MPSTIRNQRTGFARPRTPRSRHLAPTSHRRRRVSPAPSAQRERGFVAPGAQLPTPGDASSQGERDGGGPPRVAEPVCRAKVEEDGVHPLPLPTHRGQPTTTKAEDLWPSSDSSRALSDTTRRAAKGVWIATSKGGKMEMKVKGGGSGQLQERASERAPPPRVEAYQPRGTAGPSPQPCKGVMIPLGSGLHACRTSRQLASDWASGYARVPVRGYSKQVTSRPRESTRLDDRINC